MALGNRRLEIGRWQDSPPIEYHRDSLDRCFPCPIACCPLLTIFDEEREVATKFIELYHTIVVTWGGISKLNALAQDGSSTHIFHAARRLVAIGNNLDHWAHDDLRRLFSGVISIDAPLEQVEALSLSEDFRPRSLAVRFYFLATFADALPRTVLASVTHLIGFFPNAREGESALTVDRIASLFSTMPALTHLAFDVLDVSGAEDDDVGDDGYPLDLDALEIAIRAALSYPRARMVALRVCGDWLSSCPAVRALAVKLRDPRVFLWEDARPIRVWEDVWTTHTMAKFTALFLTIAASLCATVLAARPAENTPYYIRNVLTGWYWDVSFSSSTPGTPIIVNSINSPRTGNQQWFVFPVVAGTYGFQASFPTIVIHAFNTPGSGVTVESTGSTFNLTELRGNSGLFIITYLNTAITSPLTPVKQLTTEAYNPANPLASQLWEFVPASQLV
ncbi:hypothetical protein AURDEDRAFT_169383 [Auricularia subglabra TFB-10046 SS5]|nr:hypothetical protein AURDEDRAFT_169383 [Auricularia subglabra TFB-10046 SS5]